MDNTINVDTMVEALIGAAAGAGIAFIAYKLGFEMGCKETWQGVNSIAPEVVDKALDIVAKHYVTVTKSNLGLL